MNSRKEKENECSCIGKCTCIRLGKLTEVNYDKIDFSCFDDLDIFKSTENEQVSKDKDKEE